MKDNQNVAVLKTSGPALSSHGEEQGDLAEAEGELKMPLDRGCSWDLGA